MDIKVLIVEDEVLVAEDIASCMRECGFKISGIAISSEECFDSIHNLEPDIIIMDIHIQGKLDGIEIAAILNRTKKIPVIFLTASSDDRTISRAFPIQPDGYLSKPFNKQELRTAVELAVRKHNVASFRARSTGPDILGDSLFIKENTIYKRINFPAILYIEAKGSYSVIVTDTKSYTLSYNLNHFAGHVNNATFRKVHRSYIININKVEGFDNASLFINKKRIPVSKQYQKEVMNLFLKL